MIFFRKKKLSKDVSKAAMEASARIELLEYIEELRETPDSDAFEIAKQRIEFLANKIIEIESRAQSLRHKIKGQS